jgi:molecular chaperone GrpE
MYQRNGRTIKIPVRKVGHQLPAVEEEPRSLVEGRDNCQEAVVEANAEVEAEVTDWKERADRWQAEAVNVRQRAERRAKAQIQQERRRLLMRLLMVADNLERALAHADEVDPLHAGVQLTLEDLRGQLAQEGVQPIPAVGQRFDPAIHEAVATDGSGGDAVVEVLETGYTLEGELLRPARVIVGNRIAF